MKYSRSWNERINSEFSSLTSGLLTLMKQNYDNYKSITHLRNSLIPILNTAQNFEEFCNSFQNINTLNKYNLNQTDDSIVAKIKSLSDLELAFLISTTRVALKGKDESVNFNLSYAEYVSMVKSLNARIPTMAPTNSGENNINFDNAAKIWSKRDVKNVWESLLSMNLLVEKGAIGLRESAMAVFYASNYQFHGSTIPFDLRVYQPHVSLQELRNTVPTSSMYYSWTQL